LPAGSSNNIAEYSALLCILQRVLREAHALTHVQLDSLLVVRQINGAWRCLNPTLQGYWNDCHRLLDSARGQGCRISIDHIYREYNADADALANRGADGESAASINWQ